jgi:hypothetical protein
MAESCFFLHKISKQSNKTSPCCLDGWIIYSNGIGNMQVKPCSLINQLPKKCCFKLDLQWNPNDFDRNFGVLVLYFNAKFNVITTNNGFTFWYSFTLFSCLFS